MTWVFHSIDIVIKQRSDCLKIATDSSLTILLIIHCYHDETKSDCLKLLIVWELPPFCFSFNVIMMKLSLKLLIVWELPPFCSSFMTKLWLFGVTEWLVLLNKNLRSIVTGSSLLWSTLTILLFVQFFHNQAKSACWNYQMTEHSIHSSSGPCNYLPPGHRYRWSWMAC